MTKRSSASSSSNQAKKVNAAQPDDKDGSEEMVESFGVRVPWKMFIGVLMGIIITIAFVFMYPEMLIKPAMEGSVISTLAAIPTPTSLLPTNLATSSPIQLQPETDIPQIHLVSISFTTYDWNPRQIDLRTASQHGIQIYPGAQFRMFDVYVSAPDTLNDSYLVQVEVYTDDGSFIGATNPIPLVPGIMNMGGITPVNYIDGVATDNWTVQTGWQSLTVLVALLDESGEKSLMAEKTRIKLSQEETKSWWLTPPYANIAALVYQVGSGDHILADMRKVEKEGISVEDGEALRLIEIWCHSLDSDDVKEIFAEAYTTPGGYNVSTLRMSPRVTMLAGTHNLLDEGSFEWTIQPDLTDLVISLSRDDGLERSVLIDRLIIPLNR